MNRIKLDYLSVARVSGNDAGSFLQAQFTADLTRLSDGDACFSGFCLPNGTVMAVILVIRIKYEYRLIAAKPLMEGLLNRLRLFVLRAEAQIDLMNLAVFGCPEEENSCFAPTSGALRYDIAESFEDETTSLASLSQWRANELREGVAWLDSDTSNQFIPQMLGLERLNALSFRKGCFPGQEVIARVRYLGKLKRRPVTIEIDSLADLEPGSGVELIDDAENKHSAVVVDLQTDANTTVVFLVARIPEGAEVSSIEWGDQVANLNKPAQA